MAPAAWAVATASVIIRAAPWPLTWFPFRNRVAAITGAAIGVDRIASCAFSPLTLENPYAAPCLA